MLSKTAQDTGRKTPEAVVILCCLRLWQAPSDCSVRICIHKQKRLHLHLAKHVWGFKSKLVSRLPLQSVEKSSYLWRVVSFAFLGLVFHWLQDDLIQICEQQSKLPVCLSTLIVKAGAWKWLPLLIIFHSSFNNYPYLFDKKSLNYL